MNIATCFLLLSDLNHILNHGV